MKIGMLVGKIGPTRSGVGNYIVNLTNELIRTHQNELTAIGYEKNYAFGDIPYITPGYPFKTYITFLWSQVISLQKGITEDFDIIHNPGPFPLIKKVGKKYICTIHDITQILYPQFHPWWRILYSKIVLPRLIKNSDKLITDSMQTKKDLIFYYHVPEKKISVIHLGATKEFKQLDIHTIQPVLQKYNLSNPFILFIGNLEPRKNIPNLIRAFSQSKKNSPDLELVIVGRKGWMFDEIFSTVKELCIENSVKFLDFIPHEDLPALYNGARIFVYVPFYEGFGLPVLEAMQCGAPVITSNISSLPEIVGKGGIMVDPQDVRDLAEKISLLLSDDYLRQKNIQYNLIRCQQFSWEKCAIQTAEVYMEVYGEN